MLNDPFTTNIFRGWQKCIAGAIAPAMDAQGKGTQAGGSLLAICIIIGTVAGAVAGEASMGFVGGAIIGIIAAVVLWLRDRKRTR